MILEKLLLLVVVLAVFICMIGCTGKPQVENPQCVPGYLIATKEFSPAFCRKLIQDSGGFYASGCEGFMIGSNMLLNGNVTYQKTECFNVLEFRK